MKTAKKLVPLRDSVVVDITRGEKYYVGVCHELGVVTQGKTVADLKKNLREAIDLSLEDGDNLEYGMVEHPDIVLNLEQEEK